jgi:predicted TIM-barrel fold metal-dependent hydrolase
MERLNKNFPVFDCDAHVNDPLEIWDYVPESKRDLIRDTYWRDDVSSVINGEVGTHGGGSGQFAPSYNSNTIAGPQMNKKIIRKLASLLPLTDEQREYLDHRGAYDPHARVRDLDLMGIDQVLVIPTVVFLNLGAVENDVGHKIFCEAYNNWLRDWCDAAPERLFGAAILPVQNPAYAAAEVRRVAELGHPVALIRPIVSGGKYPHAVVPPGLAARWSTNSATMDGVFRAFEETGVCLGMHTFPGQSRGRTGLSGDFVSPNEYLPAAVASAETLGFVFEAQTWLGQVLLSGFLDRYPKLKMLIFESNSQWLPFMLDQCDRLFKLYRNERRLGAKRLPSEAFYEQCAISFESDEYQTFRQWRQFKTIGIWASDVYHHDAADAWSAIRSMRELGVPEDVQADLLGGNARRLYGIEPKLFVTDEPPPIDRPDWFPHGPELDEWAALVAHPRENAEELRRQGWDPRGVLERMGVDVQYTNGIIG